MNLNNFELFIEERVKLGSAAASKFRSEGKVPVNFYGAGVSFCGLIDHLKLEAALRSKTLFNMFTYANLGGKKHLVVAKILQRDSVTEEILHVDFQVVDTSSPFEMKVPISYINQDLCNDIKLGGVLNIVMSTLILRGNPKEMPAYLECDLSLAKAKTPIRLSTLSIPVGMVLVRNKLNDTIASISAIRKKGDESSESEDNKDNKDSKK